MSYADRHVVVTGGGGALGTAIVSQLIDAGAQCHVPVRSGQHVADWPHAEHPQVHVATGIDLADEATVDAFYDAIPSLWASIHVAGGFSMAPLSDTSKDDLLGQLTINTVTCMLCCRGAVRAMRKTDAADRGRIVNVAARPALEPRTGAGMAAYTASKAAVAAMTQALGEELVGEGILVNAIAPSIIDTPANRSAMPNADASKWVSTMAAAEVILALASPHNGATRGAVVPVYGQS